MGISKKSILDDIVLLLSKSAPSDDSRIDDDFLSYLVDLVRAQLIREQYKVTNVIDSTWNQDLGLVPFHNVNFADDPSVNCCQCDISKAFIPQFVSLESGNGNQDLGINVLSACGTKKYAPLSLSLWNEIPKEHTRNLFPYYSRINTAMYVNRDVEQLRIYGIFQNPEDAFIKDSTPITSGNIVLGTIYLVKGAQIVYDSVVYAPNTTFVGTATTTFTGSGTVYLNAQAVAFNDLDNYPVTGDMARQIVFEICTKEFKIEVQGLAADFKNDSKDDQLKPQANR